MRVFHYLTVMVVIINTQLYSQPMPTPEVNILSPKAESILRYGQFPVSLHTGLLDITVPIYQIKGNGFTVPIELKYHASGIKFDDVSNEVGLGWSLIAGGVISRSVRGAPDGLFLTFSRDVNTFETFDSDPSLDNEYVRIREVENGSRGNTSYDPSLGRLDGEMDMYSFSFLNHSGSFCFPFLDSEVEPGTRPANGLFIPASGMTVIDRNQPNVMLELRDTDGISYKFEVKDVDQNERYKEYYLTRIVSADKADTVTFSYDVV